MPQSPSRPAAKRVQIGDYWLEYRAERDDWCLAWYDRSASARRRRSLGIAGGSKNDPPEAARHALAKHYLEAGRPAEPAAPASEIGIGELLTAWLKEHVSRKAAPERYAQSVRHLIRFFAAERTAGRIRTSGAMVSDINRALIDRFITYRKAEGVGGHTISRDLAALRGALRHAWRHERIAAIPFIREVDPADKAPPREKVLTIVQVAALLDAAAARPDRHHVRLHIIIQLSTCARTNAVLALQADQIKDGLIHFLPDGEAQTSKRRATVPIAPTLKPWLENAEGQIIQYQAPRKPGPDGTPALPFTRTTSGSGAIRRAFAACCIAAAKAGTEGLAIKEGERWRALATPNTLRHTVITELHRRGVPEAQIETAAGHRGEGTNKRNYRHLRPDYLAELIEAIEAYWQDMTKHTTAHQRSQHGPKVIKFPKKHRQTPT